MPTITGPANWFIDWLTKSNSNNGQQQQPPASTTPAATNQEPAQPEYKTLFNPLAMQQFMSQMLGPYIQKAQQMGGGAQGAADQLSKLGFKMDPKMVQSSQQVGQANLASMLNFASPDTINLLQQYTNMTNQNKAENQAIRDNYLYDLRNYFTNQTGSGGVPGTNVSGANLFPAIQNMIPQTTPTTTPQH